MTGVAVVGLGRIGSQNDASGLPRSHVAAVLATPGLTLVAVIDPSAEARGAFRKQWPAMHACPVLSTLDELRDREAEVIALCTPAASRPPLVTTALEKRPKLLVIEKPFAANVAEAETIAAIAERHGIPVRVNFHRRFDRRHRALRQSLPGTPRYVAMRYGKGLFNYGSHLIDFLIDWFGPVQEVQALSSEAGGADPAVTFRAKMQRGFEAVLIGMSNLSYDQFEIDLFYDEFRIEIANGGTEIRRYDGTADRFYKGYSQLGPARTLGTDGPVGGLAEFYLEIRDYIRNGGALGGCDARQAIAGLEVLEAARESANRGGRTIVLTEDRSVPAH